MSTVEYVKRLGATRSRNEKERILNEAWASGERVLFEAVQCAYDSRISYGVKQVAKIEDPDFDDFEPTITWDKFRYLVTKLAQRELTGHAARDAIHAMAREARQEDWNLFYRNILLKDLRCGVSETTVNNVLLDIAESDPDAKNYITFVFPAMLAHPLENNKKKSRGRKLHDVKLNGIRLCSELDIENQTVTQYSREGNVLTNFSEIRDALQKLLPYLTRSVVLDGEVVAATFQDLMKQVGRKDNIDTAAAKYACFDIIPRDDFWAGYCKTPQMARHLQLCEMIPALEEVSGERIWVIPKQEINLDTEQGRKARDEFFAQALQMGYEGIMEKDPDAPYEGKRSVAWLKKKPVLSVDLKAVGFVEGTGKNEGSLGAILFEGYEGNKFIRVSVGSGLSDEDRQEIWGNKDKYMGMIGEIECDEITQDQNSVDVWSLRFPRFYRWRGTKPGEKL